MCEYTHLHTHSDGSLIDGLGTVDRLVSAAKEKGFSALGLTDHGTLLNTVRFVQSCKFHGVKPIIGLEAYLKESGEIFHLTLLGDGNEGLNSLIELNNIAKSSEERRATFTLSDLQRHNRGVYVLSGCPQSPLQALDWSDAREIALMLKSVFDGRFFSELMFVTREIPTWERSIKLAKDLKLPLVTTNDAHYPYEDDKEAHTILTRLKAGFDYDSSLLWLATDDELRNRVKLWGLGLLKYLDKGISNAFRLSQKLNSPIFNSEPVLPEISNSDKELWVLATNGLKRLGLNDNPEYSKRLVFEYDVISKMGFSSYFLILHDIINYAHNINVKVGVGRGSGVGCLLLYCLGITGIDPIQHGLDFERFLNPKRVEMPDVDVDFETHGREKVLEYAAQRWGGVPVATYSRYNHKSLIADLARYFKLDKETDLALRESEVDSKEFKEVSLKEPMFEKAYKAMSEQIRHMGKHAGGIIITPEKVPFERAGDTLIAAWTEGQHRELSNVGIVKFDLLGLNALSILQMLEPLGEPEYPKDGSPVFDIFKTGDLLGIFQFSGSNSIVRFTKDVQPNTFTDLVAINALHRPGALGAGTAQHYIDYKKSPRKLHPLIDDILEDTYGIICFQEQFMKIFARVTKGDLGDADIARKIIVKSNIGNPEWEAKFEKLKNQFVDGCVNSGIDKTLSNNIWAEIATHSRYSFNKAHAVAYTMLAWQMAWYKYYFRSEFYAAVLTVDTDKDNLQDYLFDVIKSGIEIEAPHVNTSEVNRYVSKDNKIYLPLSSVAYLGDSAAQEIVEQRPFANIRDFVARVPKRKVNKRAKKGLSALGAFSGLGDTNDLGIDEIEETTLGEIQQTYLGVSLPTKHQLEVVENAKKSGLVAGLLKSKELRQSAYGEYTVYKLMPMNSCWSREFDLKVGEWYVLKIGEKGKIIKVEAL